MNKKDDSKKRETNKTFRETTGNRAKKQESKIANSYDAAKKYRE